MNMWFMKGEIKMLTKALWEEYIFSCKCENRGTFINSPGMLFLSTVLSFITIPIDLILSPLEILALIIGKNLDKNVD